MMGENALDFINRMCRDKGAPYTEEDFLTQKKISVVVSCYFNSEEERKSFEKLICSGYLKYFTGFGINYPDLKYRNEARMLEIVFGNYGKNYLKILKERKEAVDYILKTAFEPLQDYGARIFLEDGEIRGEIDGKEYLIASPTMEYGALLKGKSLLKENKGIKFSEFMKAATDWLEMDFISSAFYQIPPGWKSHPFEALSFRFDKLLDIRKELFLNFLVKDKGNKFVKAFLNKFDTTLFSKISVIRSDYDYVKKFFKEIEKIILENKRENVWLLSITYLTAASVGKVDENVFRQAKKILIGRIMQEVKNMINKKGKPLSKREKKHLTEKFPLGIKEIITPYLNRDGSDSIYSYPDSLPIPAVSVRDNDREKKKKHRVIL